MKEHIALTIALALAIPSTVHAQHDHASLYMTVNIAHVSNADRGSANDVFYFQTPDPEQYAGFWTAGITGGLTVHLVNISRTSLGLDLRGFGGGGKQSLGGGFGGLQLAYKPRIHGFKPYAQISYGGLETTAIAADPYVDTSTCFLCAPVYVMQSSTRSGFYHGFQFFAGADYRLNSFVDFRALELGYGIEGGGSSSYNSTPLANPRLFSIDTGLLVHF